MNKQTATQANLSRVIEWLMDMRGLSGQELNDTIDKALDACVGISRDLDMFVAVLEQHGYQFVEHDKQ